ncbi:phosphotransferase enzyme family protein [Agrococcus citreus]|uniref:Phosphotransferase n=1 Tax=Agrococcus citreus TaxID=84643 RepID=A0ABN1YQR2_9MICO
MDIDEAAAVARLALDAFGLSSDAPIAFVKHRENHVFRADVDDASYAVRVHRSGYHSDGEIRTELEYVRALRDAGVPVPDVLATRDGSPFARVTTGDRVHLVSLQRWLVDAQQFGDVDAAVDGTHAPEAAAFTEIGAMLAELHVATARIGVPDGFERAAWDADGLAGRAPLWGDPRALRSLDAEARALLDTAAPALHDRLRGLGTGPDRYGVVHADATPENILRCGDGFVLIDFDDFGTGWFVFDLVTALFFYTGHPRAAEYERALLEGYEAIRPLSATEHAAWDALDLARGLSYLGWAAGRPGDPASAFIAEAIAPRVLSAATAFVAGDRAPWRAADAPHHEGTPA